MRRLVVDASVVIKWLLPERGGETDVEAALELLQELRRARAVFLQPPHWLAEAAAVVTRLSPATAERQIAALCDLGLPVLDDPEVYRIACGLSRGLGHHLFDTLYHATALHAAALHADDVLLVTADERYHRKAQGRGRIVLLRDLVLQ